MAAASKSSDEHLVSSVSTPVAKWEPAQAALWERYATLWQATTSLTDSAAPAALPAVGLAHRLRYDALVKDGSLSHRIRPEGWSISNIYGEVAVDAAWDILATAALLWRPSGDKSLPMANTAVRSGSSGGGELPTASTDASGGKDAPVGKFRVPGKFIDLGSGAGRLVMCTALTGIFDECVGIELDGRLHQSACAAAGAMIELDAASTGSLTSSCLPADADSSGSDMFPAKWSPSATDWPETLTPIKLECADLTKVDWADAAVVFVTATCFSEPLLAALTSKSTKLKSGSVVVSMGRALDSPLLEFCGSRTMTMAWGKGTMHVYRRARGGKWLAGVLGKRR